MTQELMHAVVVLNDEETWSSVEDSYIHLMPTDAYDKIMENFKLHYEDFEWSVSIEELLNFYLSHKALEYTPLKTEDAA